MIEIRVVVDIVEPVADERLRFGVFVVHAGNEHIALQLIFQEGAHFVIRVVLQPGQELRLPMQQRFAGNGSEAAFLLHFGKPLFKCRPDLRIAVPGCEERVLVQQGTDRERRLLRPGEPGVRVAVSQQIGDKSLPVVHGRIIQRRKRFDGTPPELRMLRNFPRFQIPAAVKVNCKIDAALLEAADEIVEPVEHLRIQFGRRRGTARQGAVIVMNADRVVTDPGECVGKLLRLPLRLVERVETEVHAVKTDRRSGPSLEFEMAVPDDKPAELPGRSILQERKIERAPGSSRKRPRSVIAVLPGLPYRKRIRNPARHGGRGKREFDRRAPEFLPLRREEEPQIKTAFAVLAGIAQFIAEFSGKRIPDAPVLPAQVIRLPLRKPAGLRLLRQRHGPGSDHQAPARHGGRKHNVQTGQPGRCVMLGGERVNHLQLTFRQRLKLSGEDEIKSVRRIPAPFQDGGVIFLRVVRHMRLPLAVINGRNEQTTADPEGRTAAAFHMVAEFKPEKPHSAADQHQPEQNPSHRITSTSYYSSGTHSSPRHVRRGTQGSIAPYAGYRRVRSCRAATSSGAAGSTHANRPTGSVPPPAPYSMPKASPTRWTRRPSRWSES